MQPIKIILDTKTKNNYILSDMNDNVMGIITSEPNENVHQKLHNAILKRNRIDTVDIIKIDCINDTKHKILVHLEFQDICNLEHFFLNKVIVYPTKKHNIFDSIQEYFNILCF
jgi:hypothetical protein